MSMPLLQTKLYVPPPRPHLVARPAMTAKLAAGSLRPLTLIAAPAGFGKTTAVSEWIAQTTQAVAWLSLDDDDNDPTRFLTYMIAALQTQQPAIGGVALGVLSAPDAPPLKVVLTLLINDLGTLSTPLALVLDDYHLITTPAIHEALTFLVDHLPPSFHLILTTRIDPPLPLARWRVRNQLTEIRADDLRFLPDEAAAFLNGVMGLDLTSSEIATLETRTEGWIAGLQLAALSLRGRQDAGEFVRAFTGSHMFIVDYLAEEVIGRQPVEVQRFLLQTSILERMCAPLCNAVTDRTDSQALLGKLQQQNLFVIPLDDERHWYRYHHLFAEVLRARWQQATTSSSDGMVELHRRASLWYEQEGLMAEAVGHALATGTFAQAARLIEQMGMMVFGQGAVHYVLTKWLAALPAELVRTRPKLGLIHAWLLFNRLDPQAALDRLEDAEQALLQTNGADADLADKHNTHGEIAATRAITATYSRQFNPEQVNGWAQIALDTLRPDNATYRAVVFGALGTAAMQQGDVAGAERAFVQAATISRTAGHEYMALASVFHLTNMQRARGALRLAVTACQQALDWAAAHGAQTTFGAGMLLIQLADLLRERNDLVAALHHATAGIALSHQGAHPSLFLVGSLVLVCIKQALGDREGIFALLDQIRQVAANLYQADWIVALLPAVEAHLHLTQSDFALALQWAQQADWDEQWPDHFRGTHHFVYAYEYSGIRRAQVLIAHAVREPANQDHLAEVMSYLERRGQVAVNRGLLWLRIKVYALQALVHQALGDATQAQALLAQALALAEPEGYVRIFVEEGEPLRWLILDLRAWLARQLPDEQHRRLLTYTEALLTAFGVAPATQGNPPRQKLKLFTASASLAGSKNQNLVEPLTPRELEVLRLIAAGHSNREITLMLVVSLGTVKKHLSNIFGKLATESRTQTIARARELGLL